ncbi:MAG: Na+/H+ antiporter subunit E [Deltaproteobacteria bacterium]|nr:Na+/H+ antiporter subunit E [Deltaproteobacteria bacterium]
MADPGKAKFPWHNFLAAFSLLFAFWVILSGFFDPFHLSLGVICSALISYVSHDLLFTGTTLRQRHLIWKNFALYLPWLIYQIYLANLHVVYLVWHRRLPIDPQIIRFKTRFEGDLVRVTLANSITLTPGTITLDIRDGEFFVHALSGKVAEDLLGGEMQDRVGRIYGEGDWRVHE